MAKPITGQYECLHRSGVGLDYFTSRIDRLTLQANGRFALISQDSSRLANAAQSLLAGQQPSTAAPESRREGYYTIQDKMLYLTFDDGKQQQGQFSWNGDGAQIGPDFFNKVSDSTVLPPTHRLKKDMEDIAKGVKIAGTIGSTVFKAAKTIHETLQSAQTPPPNQQNQQQPMGQMQNMPPSYSAQQAAPAQSVQSPVGQPAPVVQNPTRQQQPEAVFCDQCGAPLRPGKRFCNNCGAQLP